MKRCRALLLVCTLAISVCGPAAFATEGMFEGKVVTPPVSEPPRPGWIYVQGRNHMLRRVEVSHADVVFGQQIPASQQHPCHQDCLQIGQEVRVIAEQDSSGEWRAKRVEILRLTTNVALSSVRPAHLG